MCPPKREIYEKEKKVNNQNFGFFIYNYLDFKASVLLIIFNLLLDKKYLIIFI